MKFIKITLKSMLSLSIIFAIPAVASSCSGANNSNSDKTADTQTELNGDNNKKGGRVGGPQLGTPGGGPAIDKSGDSTLQAMIKTEMPEFKQIEYKDAQTGIVMKYNLFTPKNADTSKKYPLVLFMADASTPGTDVTRPLTQGYGALVWASAESQAKNPCYVLVPQFSGVAINDFTTAYRKLEIAHEAIGEATENLRLNENYYHAGVSTISDLLDAQTLYRQSLDRFSEARADYEIKKVTYMVSTGR